MINQTTPSEQHILTDQDSNISPPYAVVSPWGVLAGLMVLCVFIIFVGSIILATMGHEGRLPFDRGVPQHACGCDWCRWLHKDK